MQGSIPYHFVRTYRKERQIVEMDTEDGGKANIPQEVRVLDRELRTQFPKIHAGATDDDQYGKKIVSAQAKARDMMESLKEDGSFKFSDAEMLTAFQKWTADDFIGKIKEKLSNVQKLAKQFSALSVEQQAEVFAEAGINPAKVVKNRKQENAQ